MNSTIKYTLSTAFCCLFILSSIATAQDKSATDKSGNIEKSGKTSKATSPVISKELEVKFPDVDGWEKGELYKYPTAELGYSVTYESEEGGRVTVYVYKGGAKNISSDVEDKVIKNEIARAKSDILAYGEAGYYQDIKEIKKGEIVTLGGKSGKVKAQYSNFNFKAKEQALTSEIYLFGYQNNFIKIRATRLRETAGAENKSMANLLAALEALFSK